VGKEVGWFPVFFLAVYPVFSCANRHTRYLLPILPFLSINIAGMIFPAAPRRRSAARAVATALLAVPLAVGYGFGVRAVISES
jgi:hypothetical protein